MTSPDVVERSDTITPCFPGALESRTSLSRTNPRMYTSWGGGTDTTLTVRVTVALSPESACVTEYTTEYDPRVFTSTVPVAITRSEISIPPLSATYPGSSYEDPSSSVIGLSPLRLIVGRRETVKSFMDTGSSPENSTV